MAAKVEAKVEAMILLMNREIVDCGSQGGSQGGSDDSFDEHLSQIQIEEERQDMTDVSMSPDYFYVNKSILKLTAVFNPQGVVE